MHMGVRRGAKRAFSALEIETKNEECLEKLESAAQFRSLDLMLAIAVYLPVWDSHCTQSRFTVLVLCTDELAVHSCPFLRLLFPVRCATAQYHLTIIAVKSHSRALATFQNIGKTRKQREPIWIDMYFVRILVIFYIYFNNSRSL